MYVCIYVCMYKVWVIKSSPCTVTFNDLFLWPYRIRNLTSTFQMCLWDRPVLLWRMLSEYFSHISKDPATQWAFKCWAQIIDLHLNWWNLFKIMGIKQRCIKNSLLNATSNRRLGGRQKKDGRKVHLSLFNCTLLTLSGGLIKRMKILWQNINQEGINAVALATAVIRNWAIN
jgi:hypothetical protein